MSFNKNLKNLKSLEITIPKKNIDSFKKLFILYQAKTFTNYITVKNLALKLSSRGTGPQKAIQEIERLYNLYLESLKPKPASVSVVKISQTENSDYTRLTHKIQLIKMMKSIPNALYMQTVKYYDSFDELVTKDLNYKSWKWIGTTQQLTKEAILAIDMANTINGMDYQWRPREWANSVINGYALITTYAFKNITNNQIKKAYPTQEQTYADNESNSCVYDGLLSYFKSMSHNRNAKAIYNKLIANESIYKKPFKESELAELGEYVKSSIVIKDLVNGNDKIFNDNQFNRFRIEFINSRYGHLELYLNSNSNLTYLSEQEYKHKKETLNFYVERYGTLTTITDNYKIEHSEFKKLFTKWKLENKFNTLSINYNDDTYQLLQHYDFGMHRFINNYEIDDSLYSEYDLKKAYFNYSNITINKHYKGVPSGSFINCSCENWTINTFNEITSKNLIGFYQVEIIKSTISDKLGFIVGSQHVLASSMITLLKSRIEFKFINASYAPMVHIPFTDEFLNKENDIKHYCKAFGHMLITSTTSNTEIKINKEDLKYYTIIKKDNCNYYSDKNIIHMTEPIENSSSHIHIAYTIHAYTQTLVLEEMLKHDIDDIFGVKLDSIVFKKSVKLVETNNWSIKEGKIESLLNRKDQKKEQTPYIIYKNYIEDEPVEITLYDSDDEPEYKGEKITRSNLDNNIEDSDDDSDDDNITPIKQQERQEYQSLTETIYKDVEKTYYVKDSNGKYTIPEKVIVKQKTSVLVNKKIENKIMIYEDVFHLTTSNYKIASKPDIKFKQIMTQNNIPITSRVVFIGGKGGSGKTHSLLNFFDQHKLCYTTMCWNLIQGKKQDYKNIIGLSINKLTGKVSGKTCEKTNNTHIRVIVIDEATLLNNDDISDIIDEYYYAYIFILGDVEKDGFYYQCSNQNKVIKPSDYKMMQYIEYTKSYRFDSNLNNKLDDLRTFMKANHKDQYKTMKIQQYVKSNFQDNFKSKDTITYNNSDVGICATDDYKKDNNLTKYFTEKGTTPKYFIKTTNIYKGQLRGQELDVKPDHSNYEEKLFKTIHSFQGLDLNHNNKIIISVDKCFDYNLYYTAISRARRLDQIIFI
jgi:hypothetical protein